MVLALAAAMAAAGALGAFLARRWPRAACLAGVAGLGGAVSVTLVMPSFGPLLLGEAALADTAYARGLVTAFASTLAGLLVIAALISADSETPIVASAVGAVAAVTLALDAPSVALPLVAGAGFLGLFGARRSWLAGFRQAALVLIVVMGALAVSGAIPARGLDSGAPLSGPTLIALVLAMVALGLRLGVLPFHPAVVRVARGAPFSVTVIAAAWLPALLALVVGAWLAHGGTSNAVTSALERPEIGVPVVAVGALTIVLAVPAMLVQEDLGAMLAVHAVADGALVFLALAAGPDALASLAIWLVVSAAARTAFAAWCLGVSARMGTRLVRELRGWARVAPLLVPGLVIGALPGIGVPGFAAFEARVQIVQGALASFVQSEAVAPLSLALVGASVAVALGYVRLLLVGLRAPEEEVRLPAPRADRLARWSAAGLVVALGLIPLYAAVETSGLAEAARAWMPYSGR